MRYSKRLFMIFLLALGLTGVGAYVTHEAIEASEHHEEDERDKHGRERRRHRAGRGVDAVSPHDHPERPSGAGVVEGIKALLAKGVRFERLDAAFALPTG